MIVIALCCQKTLLRAHEVFELVVVENVALDELACRVDLQRRRFVNVSRVFGLGGLFLVALTWFTNEFLSADSTRTIVGTPVSPKALR